MKKLRIAIIFLMLTNVTACANNENKTENVIYEESTNIETTIEEKTEVENITVETTYESLSAESEINEELET